MWRVSFLHTFWVLANNPTFCTYTFSFCVTTLFSIKYFVKLKNGDILSYDEVLDMQHDKHLQMFTQHVMKIIKDPFLHIWWNHIKDQRFQALPRLWNFITTFENAMMQAAWRDGFGQGTKIQWASICSVVFVFACFYSLHHKCAFDVAEMCFFAIPDHLMIHIYIWSSCRFDLKNQKIFELKIALAEKLLFWKNFLFHEKEQFSS